MARHAETSATCWWPRARGAHLLQERHGKDLNARTIAVLIDAVIEILQKVVRSELN
jgi:hypothetical protein